MTSHELARELLAGPDLPVQLSIANPKDTAYTRDVRVRLGSENGEATYVRIDGWVASDDEDAFAPWADYEDED